MKKLIRSRSLYIDDSPKVVPTAPPRETAPPQAVAAPKHVRTTVQPVRLTGVRRYLPVNPGDDRYSEAYERECIQLESAQTPELPSPVPVATSEGAKPPFAQARILEGSERDAIIRRYRTHDRQSMLAMIPLHTPSSWVIFEHGDGNHTCANFDW